MTAATGMIDVRTVPPPQRHPLIFGTFDALEPGQAFEIVNDHDPMPLYFQFEKTRGGQFAWRYGFWKLKMLKRYPHTLRWRQALPPLFVLSVIVFIVLSLFFGLARYALAAQLAIYFFVLGLAGLKLAVEKRNGFLFFGLPLAITTMHLSWGAGFLWSFISSPASARNHG